MVFARLDNPLMAHVHVEQVGGTEREARPPTSDTREAVSWALTRADQVLLRDERDERPGTYYWFGREPAGGSTPQVRPGSEYDLWEL